MSKPKTPLDKFRDDPRTFVYSLAFRTPAGLRPFGEVATDEQRLWIDALAPTFVALAKGENPPLPRIFCEATKGFGKGMILAGFVLWLLSFASRFDGGQIAAADADNASEIPKSMSEWMTDNEWLHHLVEIQAKAVIGRKTGAKIDVIPADVAGSHGSRPALLIVDELHAITKWPFVQNLLDNAAKVTKNATILVTNSGHIGTECWKLREICRTSPRWKFLQFSRPAPHISPEELEEAKRRNSSERFKRLYFGVWSRGLGDALDVADVEAAVDVSLSPLAGRTITLPNGKPTSPTFMAGLDLGIKHDHSALVVLAAVHETRRIQLAHVESWAPSMFSGGKVDLRTVQAAVLAAHRKFGFSACWFDPWQAAMLADGLRSAGVRMEEMTFSGGNLNRMATTLLEVHRSRQVDWYDCPRLVDDVMRLRIVEKSYGHRLEATSDADGHADVATAYCIALPAAVDALGGLGPVIVCDHAFWLPHDPTISSPGAYPSDAGSPYRPSFGPQS